MLSDGWHHAAIRVENQRSTWAIQRIEERAAQYGYCAPGWSSAPALSDYSGRDGQTPLDRSANAVVALIRGAPKTLPRRWAMTAVAKRNSAANRADTWIIDMPVYS